MQPGVEGDGEEAAEEADGGHAEDDGVGVGAGEEGGDALELVGFVVLAVGEAHEEDAEYGEADGADGDEAQVEAVAADFAAQNGAGGDAYGEEGEHEVVDVVVAAEVFLGEGGQLGGVHRADEPEPGDADDGGVEFFLGEGVFEELFGAADDVGVDVLAWVGRADVGHEEGGGCAEEGDEDDEGHDDAVRPAGGHGAEDLAEEDGEEGARFDEAVAHHEVFFAEVVGQDGVFEGAEQGGVGAHAEEHGQQQGGGLNVEAVGGGGHDEDFEDFDGAGEAGFVVTGADLAGN